MPSLLQHTGCCGLRAKNNILLEVSHLRCPDLRERAKLAGGRLGCEGMRTDNHVRLTGPSNFMVGELCLQCDSARESTTTTLVRSVHIHREADVRPSRTPLKEVAVRGAGVINYFLARKGGTYVSSR